MQYPIIDNFISAYLRNGWTGLDIPETISISSRQEGEGIPTLDNIRKIIPGAKLNINNELIDIYDGVLDVNNKTLTVTSFLYWYNGSGETWLKSGRALNGYYNNLRGDDRPHNFPVMQGYSSNSILTIEKSNMFKVVINTSEYFDFYYTCFLDSGNNFNVPIDAWGDTIASFKNKLSELYNSGNRVEVLAKMDTPIVYNLSDNDISSSLEDLGYGISHHLKLPLPHYFQHPVIDALISAADGQHTEEEKEILRHYLTPLGIGGI